MQNPPQLMNITTEQIQKLLEENKELIMTIMENQNKGMVAESAPFQAQLQQNLMYLANIADAQSQALTSSQMKQEQHGQSAQAAMVQQHPGSLAQKFPFHSSEQQQLIYLQQQQQQQQQQRQQQQQQQLNQPHVGLRSGGPSGAYQGMQTGFGNNSKNNQDDAGEGFRNSTYGQR